MRYKTYKKLTPEQKEEYIFKFGEPKNTLGNFDFDLISLSKICLYTALIPLIALMIWAFLDFYGVVSELQMFFDAIKSIVLVMKYILIVYIICAVFERVAYIIEYINFLVKIRRNKK